MSAISPQSLVRSTLSFLRFVRQRGVVPMMILLAVGMLAVPLPPTAIDCMVAFNLLIGVFLLSATIDGDTVLGLRAFPSLLLVSTIFRLSVNVTTTRAILTAADAGRIIHSFGDFVVGGQIAVGLVVFLVVSIVQFLVVAKGGERIAEVGARFTLDALPGKQMSIDLDLKNGDITKEQGRLRRQQLEQESQFFGSMDGAMRFVKGDSIAGLLIVCVNLVGGLLVGMFGHDLSAGEAAHTYSILSIGDGLAAQIPSILSTIAAGILATRISEENAQGGLSTDILAVISREKRSLGFAAGALAALGLAPGFPHVLLLAIAGCIGAALFVSARRQGASAAGSADAGGVAEPKRTPLPRAAFNDPLAAHVPTDVADLLTERNFVPILMRAIQAAANEIGIGLNVINFRTDPDVEAGCLCLHAEGRLLARLSVDPDNLDVLATQIVERAVKALPNALVIDDVEGWLDNQSKSAPKLVESVREQVPILTLTHVLRKLLAENVRLAHPRPMLMELVQSIATRFGVEDLLADARLGLADQIVARHAGPDGMLHVFKFTDGSAIEIARALSPSSSLGEFDQRETSFRKIASVISSTVGQHVLRTGSPVLVVEDSIRADLRARLAEHDVDLPVLSHAEAAHARGMNLVASIEIEIGLESGEKTFHDFRQSESASIDQSDQFGQHDTGFDRSLQQHRASHDLRRRHRNDRDFARPVFAADRHGRPGRFQQ